MRSVRFGSQLPVFDRLTGPLSASCLTLSLLSLSLSLTQNLSNKRRPPPIAQQTVTLAQCVDAFLQPEQLQAGDEWYCPRCKDHVAADKKLDLWSLPEVLVVHLKRFSYTRWHREKLDTRVDFPLEGLDLAPYLLPSSAAAGGGAGGGGSGGGGGGAPVYDCFAVSNHYGGMGGGERS